MIRVCALGLILLGLIAPLSVMAQQEAPYAVLDLRVPEGALLPTTIPLDLADIAATLRVPLEHKEPLCLLEGEDGKLAPLPSQFEPGPGFDWQAQAQGTLALRLPPNATGNQRVRVYVGSARPTVAGVMPTSDLKVDTAGGRLVVESEYYRLTHDPAKQAGLPSRFEFKATGKTFEAFTWNDRLWDTNLKGFNARDTRKPRIELVAQGPVRTLVRVYAEYVQGTSKTPDSHPTAVYEFAYLPNSPLIGVTAQVTQQQAFDWSQAHLAEINFPGTDFSHYLTSGLTAPAELKAEKKSYSGSWGALVEGANVLGLVSERTLIYDGRGEYGTYLHGPWEAMTGSEHRLATTLFVSAEPGAAAQLQEMAKGVTVASTATVTTSTLQSRLASVRTQISTLSDSRRAGLWAWALSLVERESRREGRLAATDRALVTMSETLGRAGADPFATLQPLLGKDARLTPIENGEIGLGFLQRAGQAPRLVSLFDFDHQRELLLADGGPLFRLELSAGSNPSKTVTAEDSWAEAVLEPGSKTKAGTASCLLRWRTPADTSVGDIEVQVPVQLEGRRITWSIAVRPHSDALGLRSVAFPSISLQRLSEGEDYAFVPGGSGTLTANPTQRLSNFDGLWPNGWCTLQFGGYYDSLGGVYFAAHDGGATAKNLRFRRLGNGIGCEVSTPAPNTGVAKNDFASFPCVLEVFDGDWFDAAQIYKTWAKKETAWWPVQREPGIAGLKGMPRPTPQWMVEMPMWTIMSGAPTNVLDPCLKLREYLGVPLAVHWYSWHQIPFDNDYPHYFPVKEGFAEGVRRLQEGGVRVMPYINGRLWDSDTDDFKTLALPNATKDEKGDYYIEVYGSKEKLVPMCPTTKVWQDKVKEIVLRLTGPEYNVDGVYIDQVAAARPVMCFDATHGHPLGGGNWWTQKGYWPMLGDLVSRLPADKMLTTECNAEPYARWFDGYLTWHFQSQDMIPLFAAVYGGRLQMFSRSYGGSDKLSYRMKAAQEFVFGEQLGWIGAPVLLKDLEVTGSFFRRLARLRYALVPYLARGEMAHPPVVEGEVPEVTADWAWHGPTMVTDSALQRGAWKSQDGKLVVLLVNVLDKPLQVTLKMDGTRYGFAKGSTLSVTPRSEDGSGTAMTRPATFDLPVELPAYGAIAYEIAARSGAADRP
ncbi:DUF6259 domain-containing protein [bacterium]|nr:DUF6259 domain-containing protein [bacterium]